MWKCGGKGNVREGTFGLCGEISPSLFMLYIATAIEHQLSLSTILLGTPMDQVVPRSQLKAR